MPQINSNSKIMDSGTCYKDSFDKTVSSEPAFVEKCMIKK